MSIVVFGAVGTLYTAIGGIKSVVWTDVIQTVVVYVGIFAIIAKASIDVGGVAEVWRIAEEGGRINFNRLSFDPRVRHTIWGLLIGHTFVWLVNGFNQATLQRISSMRSVRDAGLAYLCSAPLILVYAVVFSLTGLVIYAYFTLHECDPFQAKLILNRNQLAPYFVLHTMSDMPGMAGLYVSAICCGALSTLSSGINALAANTVEDILPRVLQSLREGTIVFITKLLVLFYGALVIGLTYFATSLEGPVTQMGITVFGAFGSPILGIFLMGATVPWANKYGAFAGVICSLTFNLWISVGNRVHGIPIKALPTVGTEGCYNWAGISNTTTALNGQMNISTDFLPFLGAANNSESIITSNQHTSKPFPMYEISYDWYSMFGTIVCLVVGLSVSFVTNRFWVDSRTYRCNEASSEARYIFPFLRRFWGMENPDVPCFSLSNAEVLVQKECDGKEGTEM
ncbi:sodium-coupled monocarboxylate transporter 1 [Plakobranchus ocellatus]|uniref:Sodium-coupled monocarboxylate transporter 1 n=1 Tax=Plakobranchus ocellatus TaxID=259542 RepID=A0AAV3YC22_9GAST|nr:sodium-coupled monocarboxylate transporter 1 [Plakobranchus ocellatus]